MMPFLLSLAFVADPALPDIHYQRGDGAPEICGVSAPNPAALIDKIMALPDLELVEQTDQYLTMMQESERRFWTFAVNKHPAAPAVICRTITPAEGGGSKLAMQVSCFADKASCDKLTHDFVAHNQRVLHGDAGL